MDVRRDCDRVYSPDVASCAAADGGLTPNSNGQRRATIAAALPGEKEWTMKTSETKRMVAGLSVALAMVGGLVFGGASRAEPSRVFVICEANFTHLQANPGFSGGAPSGSPLSGIVALPTAGLELPRDPWVDLSVAIVGCNPDGSPDIRISNIGTRDSQRFMVLEQSAAGERETE